MADRALVPLAPRRLLCSLGALALLACGGERPPAQDTTAAAPVPPGGAMTDTAGGGMAADASAITPEMIALGDAIYHGREANGLCQTCHGPDGRGVASLGPDLTDGRWLHGDGSYAFLVDLIPKGVMQPKEMASVMPPYGGGTLTPEQTRAVAAYVYSLSNPNAGR